MVGQSSVIRETNSSREMKPVRKESIFRGERGLDMSVT